MRDLTINDVVHWDNTPAHFERILPFSVTVHAADSDLTASERSLIQSAIVNVAHEIRRARQNDDWSPFVFAKP